VSGMPEPEPSPPVVGLLVVSGTVSHGSTTSAAVTSQHGTVVPEPGTEHGSTTAAEIEEYAGEAKVTAPNTIISAGPSVRAFIASPCVRLPLHRA